MKYKKVLTRATIVFVCVMLFLVFFSRTLADLYVPRVTLDFVSPGAITSEGGGRTNHPSTIPLSALRQDQHGYFILYVESVPRRFFGSSYYTRIARVDAGLRDMANVAISPFWGTPLPNEPIVVNSDLFIHAGTRVRIVGHGDLG